MSLFSDLQQQMIDYRFRPNKKFGQNFIIDEELIKKIIGSAELKKTDVILEIGCGTGSLTNALLEKSKVVGVELDSALVELLEERFSNQKNFTLVPQNFLDAKLPKFNKIVALPPYNISSEIMLRLFTEEFDSAVLVFQKEFVEKLVAEPGFREYSYLSVLTDYLFEKSIVMASVYPKAFYPKPETYSSILKLKRKKQKVAVNDLEKFILFVKHVFRYKNKNFSNSLGNAVKSLSWMPEIDYDSLLEETGLFDIKTNLLETNDLADFFTRIFQE